MKKTFLRVFVALPAMFLMLGCVSIPKLENYKRITFLELQEVLNEIKLKKLPKQGRGFIVDGYILRDSYGSYYFTDAQNSDNHIRINFSGYTSQNLNLSRNEYLNSYGDYNCKNYHSHKQPANYEPRDDSRENINLLLERIDMTVKHTLYIGIYDNYYRKWREPCIDKIEGLRTIEEATAIRDQKINERRAEEEARRRDEEEANRYDPSKFTIVPSDFKPTSYTDIDLFTAVANIEKMPGVSRNSGLGDLLLTTRRYVSDVIFVSQNGTDILFRTNDDAISQYMKVEGRSGLTAGQSVRLYYVVTKHPLPNWRVVAIERQ